MHQAIKEPVFTSILTDVNELRPIPGSLYITGTSVEKRSEHTSSWESSCPDVTFARLLQESSSEITLGDGIRDVSLKLRSSSDFAEFFKRHSPVSVYLDITGLPHHVWAPILRALRKQTMPTYCIYVEPGDYRFSATPTESTIFDLSERINGIAPLPGFVSLAATNDEDALFVPLLGFEGARFGYMLEAVQPKGMNICPVIGVPGFRPEYPFYTYLGNRHPLRDTKSWQNVRYAAANCPFAVYQVLGALAEDHHARWLKIAPIGTKPHALGAVLYNLDHPTSSELVYDHPIRKAERTLGVSRICIYDLSLLPPIRPNRGLNLK